MSFFKALGAYNTILHIKLSANSADVCSNQIPRIIARHGFGRIVWHLVFIGNFHFHMLAHQKSVAKSVIGGYTRGMARRSKKKKKKGISGCGIGPHQEVSPMGHATSTPTKDTIRLREERRNKQSGWDREQAEQSSDCAD